MRILTTIKVDLTNVSREEQQELREYLEANCWSWKEQEEQDEN